MPKPTAFRQINTNDRELKLIQSNIDSAINSVIRAQILDGVLLESVALVTGANKIEHKLDRKYVGYIVVRNNSTATVYDSSSIETDVYVTLTASAPTTVSLWVF